MANGLRPLYCPWPRCSVFLPIAFGVAFALPHPDKPCRCHQRGRRLFVKAMALRGFGFTSYTLACIFERVSAHGTSEPGIQE